MKRPTTIQTQLLWTPTENPLLAAHITFFPAKTHVFAPPPFVLVTHAMPTSLPPPPPKGRQIISSPAAWNGAAARTNINS